MLKISVLHILRHGDDAPAGYRVAGLMRKVGVFVIAHDDRLVAPDRALGKDTEHNVGSLGRHRFRRLLARDEKRERPRRGSNEHGAGRVPQIRCALFHSCALSSTGLGGIIVDIACL